jgi:hypothetical protein
VALAVLALAPAAVPESRNEGAPRVLDVPGAATATLGLASLVYAISEVPKYGWGSPLTLALVALGALLLGSFVVAERRSEAPLGSAARTVGGIQRAHPRHPQFGGHPPVDDRECVVVRAHALLPGRPRLWSAPNRLPLRPHVPRRGCRGASLGAARHASRCQADDGFGARAGSGGTPPHGPDVHRGGAYFWYSRAWWWERWALCSRASR